MAGPVGCNVMNESFTSPDALNESFMTASTRDPGETRRASGGSP